MVKCKKIKSYLDIQFDSYKHACDNKPILNCENKPQFTILKQINFMIYYFTDINENYTSKYMSITIVIQR